jgi:alkanesulfonate monooxygenase SsuD/methylene tetrahydromethanopterin reductase-like flavin-dependent oxidoreductase (luciferase family)
VLVGTASEVRDGIARYRERLGMDLLVARIEVPGAPPAARDASLERLAEIVS